MTASFETEATFWSRTASVALTSAKNIAPFPSERMTGMRLLPEHFDSRVVLRQVRSSFT